MADEAVGISRRADYSAAMLRSRSIALLALTLLALTGCGGKPTIRLQLNWSPEPEFGGFYAAAQEGLFAKEGLDVAIVTGSPSVPVPQLAASGKVEFAVIAGPQLLTLRDQGGELIALYSVFQGNPMGLMVHESSPHKTLPELWASEATVSIENGLSDFRWLDKVYPGGKRKIVPYSSNLGAFAADKQLVSQCFFTSEPVALELQGIKTRVFMVGEAGFDPYNAIVVTTRAYYDAHTEECRKFVRAIAAGWRSYLDKPQAINEYMHTLNPSLTTPAMARMSEVQKSLIETETTKKLGLGCMTEARWQTLTDQLIELGQLKSKPSPQSLFVWDPTAGTAR